MDKNKLNDDTLENITGGYIFLNDNTQYEIIDDRGNVVKTARNWEQAVEMANILNCSTKVILSDELEAIRNKNK